MLNHAKNELDHLLDCCVTEESKETQKEINEDILQVLQCLVNQNHSGFSMGYLMNILQKLVKFQPLTPLLGTDEEWEFISNNQYQNKRCASVFKRNGVAYDINKYIFSDDGGHSWWTTAREMFDNTITFPYSPGSTPEKKYIEFDDIKQYESHPEDLVIPFEHKVDAKWVDITDDKGRIDEIYELFNNATYIGRSL